MQFLFRGSDSIELGLGLELCREGQADDGGGEGGWEGQRGRVGGTYKRDVGEWEGPEEG